MANSGKRDSVPRRRVPNRLVAAATERVFAIRSFQRYQIITLNVMTSGRAIQLWIIEPAVFAVRRFARLAAPEMAGRN